MRNATHILAATFLAACAAGSDAGLTEYRNATWWDGRTERTGSLFVRDGVFVDPGGAEAGTVVDLGGRLATAPFAEGHNHNVVESIFERSNREYLDSGVFYVKVPTTWPPAVEKLRDRLQRADTVDVIFSMGGITSPGGHPVALFVNVLSESIYGGATYEDFSGQAFHEVTTAAEAVEAVRRIAAHGADFVKATLMYADDYASQELGGPPNPGLRSELLAPIVREAQAHELPVTVHVMNAADFRAAVAAGADEIAHLPGIGWPEGRTAGEHRLTPADAEAAAKAGVAVVTTTIVVQSIFRDQPERLAEFEAMQRHNLDVLREAGVEIRIGSDMYDRNGTGQGADPTRGEAENLVALGAYDARTVLERWIDTGRKIFPRRRIACLDPGCEASFLVFDADPRADIANLSALAAGVKEGIVVTGSF